MLEHVNMRKIPTTVCTMYNPNFHHPPQQSMCETALPILNDIIIKQSTKVYVHL